MQHNKTITPVRNDSDCNHVLMRAQILRMFIKEVELEGVEPSSAQGNHALSTCLFQTRFSCADKTWTTGPTPYPLKLHRRFGASRRLFPNNLRRLTLGFGTTPLERRLVRLPCKRIKLVIYCTSIKQREHTRCCQLIFRPNGLWSLQPSLRMLTHHLILPSNPVNPIIPEHADTI